MSPLLSVKDLQVHFSAGSVLHQRKGAAIKAVDGLSFDVFPGETLGLVGESGCGKSTTGRAVLQLIKPTRGEVTFDGTELTGLRASALRMSRRSIQMVFQDPYSSLDPRFTVKQTLEEQLTIHRLARGKAALKRIHALLDSVGLSRDVIDRYPHEFSGGQRQRIAIARALAVEPKLIICDEPISSLDVSVQAQVMNLFDDLQEQFGLAYLFIAHDLAAVRHISHRIAVMYLGRIVEIGYSEEIINNPVHPYTKSLISAIPRLDENRSASERILLHGDLPSPANPPKGCHFSTRCPFVQGRCKVEAPQLVEVDENRTASCHYWNEIHNGQIAPVASAVAQRRQ